jgi:hypothetical protein
MVKVVKVFRSSIVLLSLLVFLATPAHAAFDWRGPYKIARIEMTIYGDLVIVFDQTFVTSANCAPTNAVVVAKTPPGGYGPLSDSYIARIHAMALAAQARNASVSFTTESLYGCFWGAFPVLLAFNVYTN